MEQEKGHSKPFPTHPADPQPISQLSADSCYRQLSNIAEFDRILGGGIVPGSVILIGGDPGVGKSTLMLAVANGLAKQEQRTLYATGEESLEQARIRADRLKIDSPHIYLVAENNFEQLAKHIVTLKPAATVIDSIQTAYSDNQNSSPGSVGQVRECTALFVELAKNTNTPVFLVGHVTKDGSIAGPRVMEHMVDTVLYFEPGGDHRFRILRATKNRFGSTAEIGIFEMTSGGLSEVQDCSSLFISGHSVNDNTPGTAVCTMVEGSRVFLVEIQALVSRSYLNAPRRIAQGVDYNRVSVILAVLEKRGFPIHEKDVYVNVPGSIRADEPACDLAIALALVSSERNRPLRRRIAAAGEVGLTGEIRPVGALDTRIKEAGKLGFRHLIGSSLEQSGPITAGEIHFLGVKNIDEAIDSTLRNNG